VACKSAETREQRTTLDLNRASHSEDLFTVAETQFGGNEQFVVSASLVNNWRQVLVLWIGNYPMELMACSIYRVLEPCFTTGFTTKFFG
jgi:hypothetical protein